jgi:hypothetical protein
MCRDNYLKDRYICLFAIISDQFIRTCTDFPDYSVPKEYSSQEFHHIHSFIDMFPARTDENLL